MQAVCLKLDDGMARKARNAVKEFNYGTLTELIRDSLRGKLNQLAEEKAKKKAWEALFAARGSLKGKGKFQTDEEFYKWRMENSNELAKELEKEYNFKIQENSSGKTQSARPISKKCLSREAKTAP